jgi:hypothetical protein
MATPFLVLPLRSAPFSKFKWSEGSLPMNLCATSSNRCRNDLVTTIRATKRLVSSRRCVFCLLPLHQPSKIIVASQTKQINMSLTFRDNFEDDNEDPTTVVDVLFQFASIKVLDLSFTGDILWAVPSWVLHSGAFPTLEVVRSEKVCMWSTEIFYEFESGTRLGTEYKGKFWPGKVKGLKRRSGGKTWNSVNIILAYEGIFDVANLVPQDWWPTIRDGYSHDQCWAPLRGSDVKDKLAPVKTWAQKWFGYSSADTLLTQACYLECKQQLEVRIRCTAALVEIAFIFVPDYALPGDPDPDFWL